MVAGVLVAGVVDDVQIHLQLHHTDARATATRSLLRRTEVLLSSTTSSLERATTGGEATRKSLSLVTAELTSARGLLGQARSGVVSGDIEISAVHACAGGVNRSATALQDGNQSGAVAQLSAVAPVCENILGSRAGGPVYPFDFADPDILVAKGTYFAYGTNSTAGNIQIMKSTDLQHWTKAGDALPRLASWAAPGDTWAPAVISLKRTYVLYYTAAVAGTTTQCISVATARRPEGPFEDFSTAPLECQPNLGGSIDPSPLLDAAGRPYLVWKSNGNGAEPATIWAQALDPQGTALEGTGPTELLRPSQPWEGSVVEAPSMIRGRRELLAVLLGEQLGQRRLRHRCGPLCRRARSLRQTVGGSAARIAAQSRRSRRRGRLHRHPGEPRDGIPGVAPRRRRVSPHATAVRPAVDRRRGHSPRPVASVSEPEGQGPSQSPGGSGSRCQAARSSVG